MIAALQALRDQWRKEATESLGKWPRGAILPSKKLRACADELDALLHRDDEPREPTTQQELDEVNRLADQYARLHGGYVGNAKGVLLSLLAAEPEPTEQDLRNSVMRYLTDLNADVPFSEVRQAAGRLVTAACIWNNATYAPSSAPRTDQEPT